MTRCSQSFFSVARPALSLMAAAAIASGLPGPALGQSAKKDTGSAQRRSGGGGQAPGGRQASPELAMGGYCPVCIIENKQWVKGDPQFQVTYDGKTYLFPGQKQKAMFTANPAKYVPAFGGDCVVCRSKMGKRVPGSVQHAAFAGGRLYLFPAEKQQQEFLANHAKYTGADVALGGKCAVCRVEMGKDVEGKSEFAEYYRGRRYLFPGPKQQQMFRQNPAKYAVPAPGVNRRQGSGPK